MVDLGEFRRDVDLRTAPIVGAADAFPDPLEMGVELGGGIVRMLAGDAVPGSPEILVLTLEEGCDEVVLVPKTAEAAGFSHASLGNHEIDSDCTHAALIEEFAGGVEDSGPDFVVALDFVTALARGNWCGLRHGCLHLS